jgi:hypothetical protein
MDLGSIAKGLGSAQQEPVVNQRNDGCTKHIFIIYFN